MEMNGLKWSVGMAKVAEVREWQNKDTGEPQCRVVVEYWGGRQELPINPEHSGQFRKFQGQFVRACGSLAVSENRFGAKVLLTLESCDPVKVQ